MSDPAPAPMHRRHVIKVALLSLVTLGVYELYWLHNTKLELRQRHSPQIPSLLWLVAPPITGLVIFVALIGSVSISVSRQIESGARGAEASPLSLALILLLFATLLTHLVILLTWLYKYCRAAAALHPHTLPLVRTYGLAVLCHVFGLWFIWPALVQHVYNQAD